MIKDFDKWNDKKKLIDSKTKQLLFKEGDIWRCSIGLNIKSESCGKGEDFRRPVLVLKKLSSKTCIAIPLSSQIKEGTWFAKYDLHGEENVALLYQIRMIDISRFQRKIGELEEVDFNEIKKRLKNLLNL